METVKHLRHGDLIFTRVDSLPEGESVKHNGSYVLAYGEVTGHKHLLTATKKSLNLLKADNILYDKK